MKAIVKETGEEIEVVKIEEMQKSSLMPSKCTVCMSNTGRHYYKNDLIFEKEIDWEQRRYELTKAAMQGMLSSSNDWSISEMYDLGSASIQTADVIIRQLKK